MPQEPSLGIFRVALPVEVENAVAQHFRKMCERMYGLTTIGVRKLVYGVATERNISHPFSKEKNGWRSMHGCKRRYLSLRTLQTTSIARMDGYNRSKVMNFFDVYKDILGKNSNLTSRKSVI